MSNSEIIDFLRIKRNEFDFSHHVIVNEKNKSLYRNVNLEEVVAELDQYNGRMLRVISQRLIDGNLHYLLERSNEILGWYHAEESIELFKKKSEMVRVDLEKYETPALHDVMNIKGDMNLAFKDRRLTSMFYAIYEGELYEALYANKRFVGWSHTNFLEKARVLKEDNEYTIKEIENYTVYRNSQVKEMVNWTFSGAEPVTVTTCFPNSKIFKVTQGNREGWIQESENNILNQLVDFKGHAVHIEDIIMEDLFSNIERERKQSKNNMIKLLRESLKYQEELQRLKERLGRVTQLYTNLKHSKLGRIQTKIWEKKKKRSES